MAEWKLLIVMFLYAWAAYDYYVSQQYGMAVVFISYSISIIGLILAARNL